METNSAAMIFCFRVGQCGALKLLVASCVVMRFHSPPLSKVTYRYYGTIYHKAKLLENTVAYAKNLVEGDQDDEEAGIDVHTGEGLDRRSIMFSRGRSYSISPSPTSKYPADTGVETFSVIFAGESSTDIGRGRSGTTVTPPRSIKGLSKSASVTNFAKLLGESRRPNEEDDIDGKHSSAPASPKVHIPNVEKEKEKRRILWFLGPKKKKDDLASKLDALRMSSPFVPKLSKRATENEVLRKPRMTSSAPNMSSSKSLSKRSVNSSKFGISLDQVLLKEMKQPDDIPFVRIQRRRVCTGDAALQVVQQCGKWLREYGLKEEGLFRVSPDVSELELLKRQLDMGTTLDSYPTGNVSSVAAVLKKAGICRFKIQTDVAQYLRELPDPVIPGPSAQEFITLRDDMYDRTFSDDIRAKCLLIVKDMPTSNARLLLYILSLLWDVSECSDHNRMNVENLSTIFAPIFFRSGKLMGSGQLLQDNSAAMIITEHLINDVFMVTMECTPVAMSMKGIVTLVMDVSHREGD
ncbi:rho GTPase-activating protein 24-like [Planoprotostelium fungivorum]|uniref:Rho GTPase-activating protein 24-like n=1 Tax=Planoprotostelium fungivorum TaxID=1890364 RepID=A0A2P6NDA5_9EUKA|nr:rho GTPase-activating protein 24-like [Planoprotostelium fungivorum]